MDIKLSKILIYIFTALNIISCTSDDSSTSNHQTTVPARTISGRIIFNGSDLASGGYYTCSLYRSWPSTHPESRDSLIIVPIEKTYYSQYIFDSLADGDYYIACEWLSSPGQTYGMGFYNCYLDTACRPLKVTIISGAGRNNINYLSWLDPAKHIYLY